MAKVEMANRLRIVGKGGPVLGSGGWQLDCKSIVTAIPPEQVGERAESTCRF